MWAEYREDEAAKKRGGLRSAWNLKSLWRLMVTILSMKARDPLVLF